VRGERRTAIYAEEGAKKTDIGERKLISLEFSYRHRMTVF